MKRKQNKSITNNEKKIEAIKKIKTESEVKEESDNEDDSPYTSNGSKKRNATSIINKNDENDNDNDNNDNNRINLRKRKSTVINDDDKDNDDEGYDNIENGEVNNDCNNEEIENYEEEVEDKIIITEEKKQLIKERFQQIADIKTEYLKDYKQRLELMQDCICEAGFNYEQARNSKTLYLIWLSTQTLKSFEQYMIEVHKTTKGPKTVKYSKLYM